MIKGFFFDLDGTLVDTHQANFEAYRRALDDIGVTLTKDAFKKSIGHQAQVFLRWFAPGLSDDEYGAIAQRKADYYKEILHLSSTNARLVSMMKFLKQEHKIVLVTTAKRGNAHAVLEHHNLTPIFDYIITAEDVSVSKPSPEGYKLALAKVGLLPEEVIAFEDSQPGIEAAEAAGIAVVHVKEFTL